MVFHRCGDLVCRRPLTSTLGPVCAIRHGASLLVQQRGSDRPSLTASSRLRTATARMPAWNNERSSRVRSTLAKCRGHKTDEAAAARPPRILAAAVETSGLPTAATQHAKSHQTRTEQGERCRLGSGDSDAVRVSRRLLAATVMRCLGPGVPGRLHYVVGLDRAQ
jgi:hypothetical protein